MNILVTGATGFIGGAVVKRLLKTKNDIFVFVRNSNKLTFLKKVNICIGDLRDYASVKNALKNIDTVINCAGVLPHHKLKPEEYWQVNTVGVENLIKACIVNHIKRLIHVSTVGIYEKDKTPYSLSKLEGEKRIRTSKFSSKSLIIRPTIAYGPGDTRPVFLRLFKELLLGINILIGGGKNYFHTVYIDNLVDIIVKAVHNNQVLGKDFIVGDLVCPKMSEITEAISKSITKKVLTVSVNKNLAIMVARVFGAERIALFVSENRIYNTNNMKKFFKIKTDIEINEGIRRTYNWYNNNQIL